MTETLWETRRGGRCVAGAESVLTRVWEPEGWGYSHAGDQPRGSHAASVLFCRFLNT